MKVRFLGQPTTEDQQLGNALIRHLRDPSLVNLWVCVAWAKRSGLGRIIGPLAEFHNRGGESVAIIGLDEGGATIEGLALAHEVFDEAYVYFDPGQRTFHPKVYLLEGERRAVLLVGSGNLTKGGLFTNYEATTELTLDKSVADDVEFLQSVLAYLHALLAEPRACRKLTPDLIVDLEGDPKVRLMPEAMASRSHAGRRLMDDQLETMFPDVVTELAGAPGLTAIENTTEDEKDEDTVQPPGVSVAQSSAEDPAAQPATAGFWKALSGNDVSQTSSPGQIIIPIRFKNFFDPLTVQVDQTEQGGVRQSHVQFPVRFTDGEFTKSVDTARVILYEPASNHPRPNDELRFTFLDREVLNRLSQDDVLVFLRENGLITVTRRPPGWRPDGDLERRFDWL